MRRKLYNSNSTFMGGYSHDVLNIVKIIDVCVKREIELL